jgi:hypothetical protein
MPAFMIGYDLSREKKNRDQLMDAIKAVGHSYWHFLDSTWLVVTDKTAAEIRDALKDYIDGGEELLVAELTGKWASRGFNAKATDWLRSNL